MKTQRGQVLPIVMVTLVVFTLIIAALINWIQNDSRTAVKEQRSTSAINFAEAATDRGQWKLQSTTVTWAAASTGIVVPGYNFDTTYTDVPGGSYRIKFSSMTSVPNCSNCVTIIGEGRDNSTNETRAITAVYKNQVIYSVLMAGGNVTWAKGLGVFWGPIMSQGNITLMDDVVASLYFPRKYAKGVVSVDPSVNSAYRRDTNGLAPPNTDNAEWWSEYSGVPPVPVLDFAALRSSAVVQGTLNIYGCKNSAPVGAWDIRAACGTTITPHSQHFGNSWNHPLSAKNQPLNDYVWYWDGDVTLSGAYCSGGTVACNQSTGLKGSVIVRGKLTIDTPGEYSYTGHVPQYAWQEMRQLTKTIADGPGSGESPGDAGLNANVSNYNFGSQAGGDTWCQPNGTPACGWYTTVGIKGFTYVGNDLVINNFMDFNGAIWVNGNVNVTFPGGASNSAFCGIFYDDTLNVPALNVILLETILERNGP